MILRRIVVVVAALLALGVFSCSRHQPPDPNDPYREVPDADRESLRAAVTQMSTLQVSRDWEKMYALIDEPKDPKDKFQRLREAVRALKAFQPSSVSWMPDGWQVTGCGVWEPRPDQPDAMVSSLHAKSTKAGWRLTPVQADIFAEQPGHVKLCSPAAR